MFGSSPSAAVIKATYRPPVWTPLIPSTMPAEHVEDFGSSSALGRPGQPAEVAPVYVMLASDEAVTTFSAPFPNRQNRPPTPCAPRLGPG